MTGEIKYIVMGDVSFSIPRTPNGGTDDCVLYHIPEGTLIRVYTNEEGRIVIRVRKKDKELRDFVVNISMEEWNRVLSADVLVAESRAKWLVGEFGGKQ